MRPRDTERAKADRAPARTRPPCHGTAALFFPPPMLPSEQKAGVQRHVSIEAQTIKPRQAGRQAGWSVATGPAPSPPSPRPFSPMSSIRASRTAPWTKVAACFRPRMVGPLTPLLSTSFIVSPLTSFYGCSNNLRSTSSPETREMT